MFGSGANFLLKSEVALVLVPQNSHVRKIVFRCWDGGLQANSHSSRHAQVKNIILETWQPDPLVSPASQANLY